MSISDSDASRIKARFQTMARSANAKARKVGQSDTISAADIFYRWTGVCFYCGFGVDPMGVTLDHVVPFFRGGRNVPENIALSCQTCQRSKFTKTPEEYAQWLELERECPVDGTRFKPRWADFVRGFGIYCSRRCSGSVGGSS